MQILKPFLLRRLKMDVEKSLLPKIETKLYIGMSTLQRDLYQKLLMKDLAAVNGTWFMFCVCFVFVMCLFSLFGDQFGAHSHITRRRGQERGQDASAQYCDAAAQVLQPSVSL